LSSAEYELEIGRGDVSPGAVVTLEEQQRLGVLSLLQRIYTYGHSAM
jgi:hypothetical protein